MSFIQLFLILHTSVQSTTKPTDSEALFSNLTTNFVSGGAPEKLFSCGVVDKPSCCDLLSSIFSMLDHYRLSEIGLLRVSWQLPQIRGVCPSLFITTKIGVIQTDELTCEIIPSRSILFIAIRQNSSLQKHRITIEF